MDDLLAEHVLRAVEQIPPGRVVSYGDIAALVGIGPRHVGNVLRRFGSDVPWWRVVSRDGDFGGDLLTRARPRWAAEGIAVKANGLGCRIADYRADLADLDTAYRKAVANLPPE
ncbi:MAG: MGMT family protein [Ornithinimicrobium sp.]|uniref:MGMT family protein n=1 Tax=Ornithinimicrobium sp. TaxID=1977084 RepID=UPI003D9B16F5